MCLMGIANNQSRIVVGIPTYNREKLLKRLLSQLNIAATSYDVTVIVLDDGSNKPVKLNPASLNNINKVNLHRSSRNNGKRGYWITVNNLFEKMGEVDADYYFYLGDDLEVDENFFEASIDRWEAINDNKKISLNLLNDGRDECWTKFKRKLKKFEGYNIFLSQWLDMIMMMDKTLLKYQIKPIKISRWSKATNLSSGVGCQLSNHFHKHGYHMYQLKHSLVYHSDGPSVMNPAVRKTARLISIM